MSENANETLPAPQWELVKTLVDNENVKQVLIKCQNSKLFKLIDPLPGKDGKVRPPVYGRTEHVLVTVRTERFKRDGEDGEVEETFTSTRVTASDEDGEWYNADLYMSNTYQELWQVMFAIGEV